MINGRLLLGALALSGLASSVQAQDGPALFKTYCAQCHAPALEGAPSLDVLNRMPPERILHALEQGTMRRQAAERSRVQRRVLAEYLGGRPLSAESGDPIPKTAYCAESSTATAASWNGWGNGTLNHRFQSAAAAGMTRENVPRLKLKWAFGLRGATSAGTQPVVIDGRLYIATAEGEVYALDAKTGCIHWNREVEAGVRTALTIEHRDDGATVAYLADQAANVYALDARSGNVLWKVKVEEHPRAAITGAPTLFRDRLYVPVASREESQLARRCTGRQACRSGTRRRSTSSGTCCTWAPAITTRLRQPTCRTPSLRST
jgi:polyvinyl alcohol dehydrogenase (cytochrome)